jgi:hypothetical protein
VLIPGIATWVKEPGDLPGLGIDPGEIGALVKVAIDACEREVVRIVPSTMLPWDDVLHVQRGEGRILLM